MNKAIVALVILSLLVIAGCASAPVSTEQNQITGQEATPETVATETNDLVLAEDSNVEIGEML